jgi:hypothetical protein
MLPRDDPASSSSVRLRATSSEASLSSSLAPLSSDQKLKNRPKKLKTLGAYCESDWALLLEKNQPGVDIMNAKNEHFSQKTML